MPKYTSARQLIFIDRNENNSYKHILKKLLFTFIVCSNFLFGQTAKFDSLVQTGIDQIYSLQFESAEETFIQVKDEYPNHPAGMFFTAMITWWKILIDLDNEEYDDLFYDQLEEVIDFCDDILEKNPESFDAIFFKGGSLGFRGRLASIREDWFDAAADGKDAMPLVNDAYKLEPGNKDVQLGFGIYNYYAEVIPERYPFLKPIMLFFPKGDKEKGLKQLKEAAYNGKYTKTEAKYFLMTLYYGFEENYIEAQKYAEELTGKFPNNPVFEKYSARIKRKQSHLQSSIDIFKSIYSKADSSLTGYTDKLKREAAYYIGEDYFKKDEWEQSIRYFEESIALSRKVDEEETGFLIAALIFAGKIYDVLDERERAVKYYKEVLTLDEYRSSHEQANQYLKNPYRE